MRHIRARCREAVARRLNGEREVGLFLSGGIDSSGVALWLTRGRRQRARVQPGLRRRAASRSEQAQLRRRAPAASRCAFVPVERRGHRRRSCRMVWKLDLPFGDPVTGPQYLLGRAAREAGLSAVFNGEGGDQLFGGWTSKPMISAELYAGLYERRQPRGAVPALVPPLLRAGGAALHAGVPARRSAGPASAARCCAPYLRRRPTPTTFLNRVRLADISLKGSQNILPRAERMANGVGARRCACRCSIARWPKPRSACRRSSSCTAPARSTSSSSRCRGICPREIVWRRKFGMSVPVTDWVLGPLAPADRGACSGPSAAARARSLPRRVRRAAAAGPERAAARPGAAASASGCGRWPCSRRGCGCSSTAAAAARRARHEVHPLRQRQQVQGAHRTERARAASDASRSSRKHGDRFTDAAFKAAIDAVSAAGPAALGRRASLLRDLPAACAQRLEPAAGRAASVVAGLCLFVASACSHGRLAAGAFSSSAPAGSIWRLSAALARSDDGRARPARTFDAAVAALARGPRQPDGPDRRASRSPRRRAAAGSRHRRLLVRPRRDLRPRADGRPAARQQLPLREQLRGARRSTAIRRGRSRPCARCCKRNPKLRSSRCTTRRLDGLPARAPAGQRPRLVQGQARGHRRRPAARARRPVHGAAACRRA